MLSRVAENLYWMARYIERTEDTARLIRVTRHLMLDFPGTTTLSWSSLIHITGADAIFDEHYGTRDAAKVLTFLCADRRYGGSIMGALAAARENLRTTRDVMPKEVWEEINSLYLQGSSLLAGTIDLRRLDDFLRTVIRGCQALTGMIDGSLSESPARTFCAVGGYLERVDMTSRILDVRSANLLPRSPDDLKPFEQLQWMSVLKSLSAHQMYRRQVRTRIRGKDAVRFILLDTTFPRAINRCLKRLHGKLATLPRSDAACAAVAELQQLLQRDGTAELADAPDQLHQFLDDLQLGTSRIHDAIRTTWFGGVDSPAPVVDETVEHPGQ
ncbi:alpha-E domain-containing protein [Nitrogeniibacter mangrovi]|uniref:Alpha-E domain-containing protein n=1 Tax=Nitrogeniibacter mangrovi TaxID=2016596 RepID=A0A6C1B7T7_9RHOO|nr:alpha-E domain-containing protein [Nitrogeniibacter mangrovi]QID19433.1 alpha-E domain-containing protein [Nitrogeniibacter mangrovi]